MITFGSYSKFQSPAHRDGFFIYFCITLCSVLSGMVLFSAIGIMAKEQGQDVRMKLKEYQKHVGKISNEDTFCAFHFFECFEGIGIEIIYSALLGRIPYGVRHLLATAFFLLYSFAGWYSMVSNAELLKWISLLCCFRLIILKYSMMPCILMGNLTSTSATDTTLI